MKTIIFNGSPRPAGDTASLIERLCMRLPGEIVRVDAYRSRIAPCVDCRHCWEQPGCAVQDDMQRLYREIEEADCIVIASPVYFSELTGKLLDVMSRLQMYYCARVFQGRRLITRPKRGAVILVGGGDGAPDRAHETAKMLLRQMNCTAVHPLVCSHNTNHAPAISDQAALAGVNSIARFLVEAASEEVGRIQ